MKFPPLSVNILQHQIFTPVHLGRYIMALNFHLLMALNFHLLMPPKGMTRRDGTVCARLRIGHLYLTHCYLLKGEPQPFCVNCNEALTINHLLTNCA